MRGAGWVHGVRKVERRFLRQGLYRDGGFRSGGHAGVGGVQQGGLFVQDDVRVVGHAPRDGKQIFELGQAAVACADIPGIGGDQMGAVHMRLTSLFGGAGRPALCKRQAKTRCPPLNVPSASIAQQRRIYRCPRNKSGTLLKNSPRHRHSARRAWLPAIVYHRPSPAAKCFGALCANLRRPNRKKTALRGRPWQAGGAGRCPFVSGV